MVITGFDSCLHMSEEASNAVNAVPFGILLSKLLAIRSRPAYRYSSLHDSRLRNYPGLTIRTTNGANLLRCHRQARSTRLHGLDDDRAIHDGNLRHSRCFEAIMAFLPRRCTAVAFSESYPSGRATYHFGRSGAASHWQQSLVCSVSSLLQLPQHCSLWSSQRMIWHPYSPLWHMSSGDKRNSSPAHSIPEGPAYLLRGCRSCSCYSASSLRCFRSVGLSPRNMNYTIVIATALWGRALGYYYFDACKWQVAVSFRTQPLALRFTDPRTTLNKGVVHDVAEKLTAYPDQNCVVTTEASSKT